VAEAALTIGAARALALAGERTVHARAERIDLVPRHVVPTHAHPRATEIYLVEGGGGEVTVSGEAVTVTQGSFVVIPRGAQHAIVAGPEGLVFTSMMVFTDKVSLALYGAMRLVHDTPWLRALHARVRGRS
jgi:quercetin dioxygenase-like cupin family protein